MPIVSSLAWEWFVQHMLRCIFCPRWHGRGLVNTYCHAFCVLAFIDRFWSIEVELYFESMLAWAMFGQPILLYLTSMGWVCEHTLRYSLRTFCVLSGMESVLSTNVSGLRWHKIRLDIGHFVTFFALNESTLNEIHFESLLTWEGSGQHKLR